MSRDTNLRLNTYIVPNGTARARIVIPYVSLIDGIKYNMFTLPKSSILTIVCYSVISTLFQKLSKKEMQFVAFDIFAINVSKVMIDQIGFQN